jgi:nitrogen regulatory protein P-II 1
VESGRDADVPADGNGASSFPAREGWGFSCWTNAALEGGIDVMKVEAVVVRDRVETVMEAVEEHTGHVGVTVVEAVGHGREKGITHEYRGRVFESRFLPKAHLTFVVRDEIAEDVIEAIVDSAKTGHVNGDGICWMSPITNVTHNRTGQKLEEVERV